MTEIAKQNRQLSTKEYFKQPGVEAKFKELLGAKAPAFVTSVLQAVASNPLLAKADPASIYNSAAVAAILDLPINNSIGQAYIIPYKTKQPDGTFKDVAQFQIGWKGFKQLALRSGQFKLMNETDVREGEITNFDRLSGEITFNWIQDSAERNKKKIIGYVSYFRLTNGYEHTYYMTKEEVIAHATKYSQSFKKNFGPWKDDFDSMAIKTVVKLNLNKNAPLSTEMQKAITVDQSVIKDESGESVDYVDIDSQEVNHELERIAEFIKKAKSLEDLQMLEESVEGEMPEELKDVFEKRKAELQ